MALQPPLLRTVLDLGVYETTEVPYGTLMLEGVLGMADYERPEMMRTALHADALCGQGTPFPVRVMLRRLAVMAPETMLSPVLVGSAAALTGGNPARAVLWAHAIAAWWVRTGTPASIGGILVRHMDGCLPNPEGMLALWDAQKLDRETYRALKAEHGGAVMDNWLDFRVSWEPEALRAGAAV